MTAAIAVLAGGVSLEREVSLRSGRRVADALADAGHRVVRLDLDDALVGALASEQVDLAYLALHGKAGEDGTVQSLLEVLGTPYTGSDAVASALAWDKVVAKGLFRRAGLATPDWVVLSADAVRDMGAAQALGQLLERVGPRVVVKPSQGGASLGVRTATGPGELAPALLASFSYHGVALVERWVEGTEVAVSVLDGQPLPAVEIAPRDGAYDFAARYTAGAADFFVPARLADDALAACAETAVAAADALGCRDVVRADMIVDADGIPWLLELDTCPGMTETSLLPMAADGAGVGFRELCQRIVALALAR